MYWRWFAAVYLTIGTIGGVAIFLALPQGVTVASVALVWGVFYLACGIVAALLAQWMVGRRS